MGHQGTLQLIQDIRKRPTKYRPVSGGSSLPAPVTDWRGNMCSR